MSIKQILSAPPEGPSRGDFIRRIKDKRLALFKDRPNRGFSLAANKDLASDGIAVTCLMPDAMQTPMVTKQLDYDGGAYAFSQAEILTVHDLERCVLRHVLPDRPAEVWLTRRAEVGALGGLGGMLANVIHSSRAVLWAERAMYRAGLARQRQINQQRRAGGGDAAKKAR